MQKHNLNGSDAPFFSFLSHKINFKDLENIEKLEVERYLKSGFLEYLPDNSGKAVIVDSEFDSRILGLKTSKIVRLFGTTKEAKQNILSKVLLTLQKNKYQYTSVRIPFDYEWLNILSTNRFFLYDVIEYMELAKDNFSIANSDIKFRQASGSDKDKILNIGKSAFKYGRFYNDPEVPKDQADSIYQNWIINSINRKACDEIFVSVQNEVVTGFVSIKNIKSGENIIIGSIELVAVDENLRGLGIGTFLTQKASEHIFKSGAKSVLIDTQITNYPAKKTYLSVGFKPAATFMTLRLISKA